MPKIGRGGDGGVMLGLDWCQSIHKPRCCIMANFPGDTGKARDLSAKLRQPVGCFNGASLLCSLDSSKIVGSLQNRKRPASEVREKLIFKA